MNELIILGIVIIAFLTAVLIDQIAENLSLLVRFCRCVIDVIIESIFKAQTAYYKRRQRKRSREAQCRYAVLLRMEREAQGDENTEKEYQINFNKSQERSKNEH